MSVTPGGLAAEPLLSRIGYGAAPLGNVYGDIDQREGIASVHRAIELGVTFFDVSPYYGLTLAEEVLGKALRGHRQEVLLCTKAGRYGDDEFDFSAGRIVRSIDESLQRLQTDYVDVLLAHDIEFGRPEQVLEETVDALERCKQEGKCRWIGMSGYPLNVLRRAVETRHLDVVLSYCHYCLYNTQLTEDLLPAAMANGVTVLNASPLGMGLLSGSPPPPWHPAAAGLRQACERAAAYCKERGVELATVAMQFAVGAPDVACTIAGMATKELVEWNVAATATPPEPDLIEAVRAILKPVISAEWPSGRGLW